MTVQVLILGVEVFSCSATIKVYCSILFAVSHKLYTLNNATVSWLISLETELVVRPMMGNSRQSFYWALFLSRHTCCWTMLPLSQKLRVPLLGHIVSNFMVSTTETFPIKLKKQQSLRAGTFNSWLSIFCKKKSRVCQQSFYFNVPIKNTTRSTKQLNVIKKLTKKAFRSDWKRRSKDGNSPLVADKTLGKSGLKRILMLIQS
jgi:hypothetical protein